MIRAARIFAGVATAGFILLSMSAEAAPTPESFVLGRDATGEPCAASRNWHDKRLDSLFDRAWLISCRGVAASRPQGSVVAVRVGHAPAADPKFCGAALKQSVPGIGAVEARACFDVRLGNATELRFERGGATYIGSAVATAVGPLEATLRVAAGAGAPPKDPDAKATAAIDPRKLPPAPPQPNLTVADAELDPATVLRNGTALNHRGLYLEASRLLNDALSRVPEDTPSLTRIELELEAALADSNISQFEAADEHFARAGELLAKEPYVDRAAYLQEKQTTYRGLDLINRRAFKEAAAELDEPTATSKPLEDPAILSNLNQPLHGQGARSAVSSTDNAQLSRLLLESQRRWARSVAFLGLGDIPSAKIALDRAAVFVDELQRDVDPGAVVALKARIQRQYGRLAARAGHLDAAVHDFDCALATLQNVPVPGGGACPLDVAAADRPKVALNAAQTGGLAGPMIAETELERASLLARLGGVDRARVLDAYKEAIDSLIAANSSGSVVPAAMEPYLDLLAKMEATAPAADTEERFFRALQAVGEPTVARQVAQLQRVVTADPLLASKVQDRTDLERQIIRLRYQIGETPPAQAADLLKERQAAEAKLSDVDAELAADPRFRSVDDQPATLAEVRSALRPGELFLKVNKLRTRVYGVALDGDRAYVYALPTTATEVQGIAGKVLASIESQPDGSLPFFDVAAAYTLFKLVAGPAEPALLAAKAVVVDPSGPMENLPAGVLVTSLDSVKAYRAARADHPNDYSHVAFLAGRAEIAGALSPRSFLIARSLPPSVEPRPFLGLGQNAPPPAFDAQTAETKIAFGTGCPVTYGVLGQMMARAKPVSAAEIALAAAALGDPGAPEITGREFSDRAILALSAEGGLRQYQVLHFATHGLPETHTGCMRVPPSLVTTLAPPEPKAAISDGLLSFSEIARLRLDANLVVLSACQTAAGVSGLGGRLEGQDESSATLDGLVRAFITANARAVLATYWRVPASVDTDRLIRTFYASGRSDTLGGALRDAQAQAIADPATSHPYFWGAYFLVGDAGKHMLTPAARTASAR